MGRNGRRAAKRFLGLMLVLSSGGLAGCGDLASLGFAIRLLGVSLSGGARLGAAGSSSSAPSPFETVTPTRWAPGPVIGWTPTPQGWMPVYGVGTASDETTVGSVEKAPSGGLDKTRDQSDTASTSGSGTGEDKGEGTSDQEDRPRVFKDSISLLDGSTPLTGMASSGFTGLGGGLFGQE